MTATESISKVHLRLLEATFETSKSVVRCEGWEVSAGEAWFVAGGSSSGKTSLLRLLAGLERERGGLVERFGSNWRELHEFESLNQRRRIGVVLCHEAGLFHRHTVADNLRLPLLYHGNLTATAIEGRVRKLLNAFGLEHVADTPCIRLNQALARRTLLARALALEPEILLLDDPCADIEDWERRRLINQLQQLNAGHELTGGRPLTVIVAGASPSPWRGFANLNWAMMRESSLAPVGNWEQLVATAPELFHDPDNTD